MKVAVGKETVNKDLIVAKDGWSLHIGFQHCAFTQIGPMAKGSTWVFYAVFIVFLFLTIYSIALFIISLKEWGRGIKVGHVFQG